MDTVAGGWMTVTGCLLCTLVTLVLLWVWKTSQQFKTIQKLGLPGPQPKFLIGNMGEITSKGFHAIFNEWEQQYGSVYGIYRAKTPSIVIHDPEKLRLIMVKNFAAFPNRQRSEISDMKPLNTMLQFLRNDHWRHVRKTLSPTFSSGKMKMMLPVIQRCCQNLVNYLAKKMDTGDEVDAKEVSSAFSMDVTAATGFGMEVDCLQDPNETFGVIAKRILYPPKWIFTVLFLFPYLAPLLDKIGINVVPRADVKYMYDIIKAALKDRRRDKTRYKDFLQLLVDAETEETQSPLDPELDHGDDLQTDASWDRKGLTEEEIYSNSLNFLLAGYENTASGIAFLLYNLAGNPKCVQKLQEEVDAILGKDDVDYRAVTDMPYLDMCLNESLRLYPPGIMLDRECVEETELDGLHVPRGMLITIPVYSIQTNPQHWPDPLQFDPERHTPEARASRHPFCFLPFGVGPRNCIGMRMSQMEVKMAVAAIVHNFAPVLCEKSVFPAKITNHIRLGPVDRMWIKFQARQPH